LALADDLRGTVEEVFQTQWSKRDGRVVPAPEDVVLKNEAVVFDRATVLYADLTGSTKLVDGKPWTFAGEIYKSYLYCCGRIIKTEGGEITSYDGDRVMGVFVGDTQSTSAVRCALKINWAVGNVINPALKKQYPTSDYTVQQVVGIDTSLLRVARTGVRGDNDLVWIGRAANHAAKLTELKLAGPTWITADVYDKLATQLWGIDKATMWNEYKWTQMSDAKVYSSSWQYNID
jgi:class 3 adenylate cyclase